ncbi:MAG: prenyltransferase [Anaerolineae bacterium]|jgi:1,4-dihydroxy-2-naphthoate octaprenyltransferase
MAEPKTLLGPMRLPFLVLPPACVLLGIGTALWTEGEISVLHAIIAFVGALAAHISVNALNEYYDFQSGLDARTVPTPFSGGSGTLQASPEAAPSALVTGLATLALAALVGIYFLFVWGWALLPLGLLGLILVYTYTNWLTRSPLLCLIAPGLGFGTLMVMGTDFVLTGSYTWTAFVASLVPFFLVSNLLLLNQFPDVEADASVGRRHYPIVIGRKASSLIYGAFLLGTYLAIVIGWALDLLPALALLGLLTVVIAVPVSIGAYRNADDREKLMPSMGLNVLLTVLTPILTAVGLLIAS